ncbi:hypothetical protein [Beduini sp.]|uniref:hypothetical protein n=1 Tax=Beduini sp. TaxID=1922300 RepID=UPI0039903E7A
MIGQLKILFADEPTGNLDSKTGEDIMKLLQKINKMNHQTIIMVTHSKEAAQYTDRTIIMKDGQIINIIK